jgi:DNA-binding NtrC family response regulator
LLTLILEGQQLFRHPQFPAMAQASEFTETGSHQAPAETPSISTTALAASPESASVSPAALAEMERITILRVFEQTRGDKALAGKMLGISRATLYRKLKRYNIPIKGAYDDLAAKPQPPS